MRLLYGVLWPAAHGIARLRARAQRMPTADRVLLEDTIFRGVFREPAFRRILFVGVSEWTAWYPKLFSPRPRSVFATLDIDADAAVHGATRHRVGSVTEMAVDPAEAGTWDIVFLNGVFGYGTDDAAAKQSTLAGARSLLRHGGVLVVGYRPAAADRPADVDVADVTAHGFEPSAIPGLGATEVATEAANAHTFAGFRAV